MKEYFGIILVDSTEIILRVYQVDDKKWQLLHYDSQDLIDRKPEKDVTPYNIAEVIADFFSITYAQKVIEWRICAREISKEKTAEIALAIGLRIDYLDRRRQQELICKGLFTELW
jgi:hypothetical protein